MMAIVSTEERLLFTTVYYTVQGLGHASHL